MNKITIDEKKAGNENGEMKKEENIKESSSNGLLIIDPKKFKDSYDKDVTAFIEKKLGLSYLSWSYANLFLRTEFPNLFVKYEKNGDSFLFGDEKSGFYVQPFLTDGDSKTPSLFFPVMDAHNKAKKLNVDAMDINKALMRGAVKVIAMYTGLGLKLYTGEDISDSFVHTPKETPRREPQKREPGRVTTKPRITEDKKRVSEMTDQELLQKLQELYLEKHGDGDDFKFLGWVRNTLQSTVGSVEKLRREQLIILIKEVRK